MRDNIYKTDKADIIFIRLKMTDSRKFYFPLSSLALSCFIKTKGYKGRVFDLTLESKIFSWNDALSHIPYSKKFIYGITLYYGDLLQAIRVSRFLKDREPACIIIWGGPGVYALEFQILSRFNKIVDLLCIGEGELIVTEILKKINNGSNEDVRTTIKGIAYFEKKSKQVIVNPRESLIQDLDRLPFLDYASLDLANYQKYFNINTFAVIAGYGCPYSCKFCSTSRYWCRYYRVKSANRIIKEIEYYSTIFKYSYVDLIHDNLLYSRNFIRNFTNKLIQKNSNITWGCSSRLDDLRSEDIDKLIKSGCVKIGIGVETASTRMQSIIGKNIKTDGICEKIKAINNKRIQLSLFFIVDFPKERQEEIDQTLKMAFYLAAIGNNNVYVNGFKYLPGTDYYNYLERHRPKISLSALNLTEILLDNFAKSFYLLMLYENKDPTLLINNFLFSIDKENKNIHSILIMHANLYSCIKNTPKAKQLLVNIINFEASLRRVKTINHLKNFNEYKSMCVVKAKKFVTFQLLYDIEFLEKMIQENNDKHFLEKPQFDYKYYLIKYQNDKFEFFDIDFDTYSEVNNLIASKNLLKYIIGDEQLLSITKITNVVKRIKVIKWAISCQLLGEIL